MCLLWLHPGQLQHQLVNHLSHYVYLVLHHCGHGLCTSCYGREIHTVQVHKVLDTEGWFCMFKKKLFSLSQVLEFVDDHGNEVLNLGSFTLLPQHVVRLILVQEELKADEFSKFQVLYFLIWIVK